MDRWLKRAESSTGRTYFFNEKTKATAWTAPEGATVVNLVGSDDDSDDELGVAMADFSTREGFLLKAPPGTGRWKKRWMVADRTTKSLVW